jgi:D-alanyl-D-alanine carboxypeptidase
VIARSRNVALVVALAFAVAACSSTPERSESPSPVGSTTAAAPATQTVSAEPFPVDTFAAISEEPVSDASAAEFQAALDDLVVSDGFGASGGMSATVMTAAGTWSGTVGTADGVRDLRVDDQFAIASITKSVIAAQVMSMVEEGELGLDDPVADHLPRTLRFDTNGATIRDLLGHRSGIPDDYDLLRGPVLIDPQRVWTPADVLDLVPNRRNPIGTFEYAETNYLLLSQVIEHVRGRPVADVLRDDVLAVDGVERLVYQPGERPTEPIALPDGLPTDVLEDEGGYLPSRAAVTAFAGSGVMASDSPSLARWWRALCAGEIVSQASLTEMSAFDRGVLTEDGEYGLGLFNPSGGYAPAVGHQGELFGYMSWAACLPEDGAVIVVLSNRAVDALSAELVSRPLRPFVDVLRSA